MRKNSRSIWMIFVSFLLLWHVQVLCAPPVSAQSRKAKPIRVTVSILPQEFFVTRIGADRVEVETLVQPGHSPATYAPTPKQMASLAASDIYFRIGVPFENALIPKLARSIPDLTIIDLRQGIELMPIEEEPLGDDNDHHHGDLDPHTWLDPLLALQQARIILDNLIRVDPAGKDEYEANFSLLAGELRKLHQALQDLLKPLAGTSVYVFHPAYGYFCRAYNIRQKAINPSGKKPGARYLARLIEEAKNNQVRAIFIQPQFSDKAARTIARAIGARVVILDPLARDYLTNMRSIARQLVSTQPEPAQKKKKELR